MEGNRKLVLDKFQVYLNENFIDYCDRHDIKKSEDRLVTFLIDQELIPATKIQRYSVLKEFDKLRHEPYSLNKTQTVNTIAHRFNISERTVWNILKSGLKPKK